MTGPSKEELRVASDSVSHLIRRFAIRGLKGFVVVLVLEYLVLPQLAAGPRNALHLLSSANYALIPVAIAFEALSLFAYAQLTRSVIPAPAPPLSRLVKITLSTLAVSHVLPGGSAAGSAISMRMFTKEGIPPADAGFALATLGIGSAVVLNALLWLALVISIPIFGFNPLYLAAAVVGALLIAAFATLVVLFTKGKEQSIAIITRASRHLPRDYGERLTAVFASIALRVHDLARNPRLLRRATLWATLNWLLDAGSLWVMLLAFGRVVDPDSLLVAYGVANVLAAIPITPGGLGIVEAVIPTILAGFGTPRGVAILGVIGYRLFNFWLPIPVGVVSYFSLRLGGSGDVTMELDKIDPQTKEPD